SLTIKALTPIFPLTVNASIGPTTSNASGQMQFRPQDVGTTGSVYVFAVAPASIVKNAAIGKDAGPTWTAKSGPKDISVQCVLAQLNASKQLQAVSSSGLAAYATGTLSAQGQSLTILDNVPTASIAGATFYVGYGPSSAQMIATGVNRRAFEAK